MIMNIETMKVEVEAETCCVCGTAGEELWTPEEHDAGTPAEEPPLRAMLLHLNHGKALAAGRLCARCIMRAQDAYSFSRGLTTGAGVTPLGDKIRALRSRLAELTAKIDVFVVVGGAGGAGGAYSEDDIIMVDRQALAAAAAADARAPAPQASLAGQRCYQCTVCPRTFQRSAEYVSHVEGHGADAVHSCWTCGAQFAARELAEQHSAEHAGAGAGGAGGGAPAACPACGLAAGGGPAALRAHVAAAHPAHCAACLRAFPSPAERLAHSLSHAAATHFLCGYDGCILRFTTRANLVSHLRKCHGGGEAPPAPPAAAAPAPQPAAPVPCDSCDRMFGSVAAMRRHARVHAKHAPDHMEWAEEGGAPHHEGEGEEGRVEYLEVETLDEADEHALT